MKLLLKLKDVYPIKQKLKIPKMSPKTVWIEGNIGCGKTTFLEYFSKRKGFTVCFEPVEKWRKLGPSHINLLESMYKDPTRWAFTFQSYVQITMLENHLLPSHQPTKLMERSIASGRHCFIENLYQSKIIEQAEYDVYCKWYDMIVSKLDIKTDLIVYLQTDPKKLHERILARRREEEALIPFEYLQNIHDLHEKWLIQNQENLGVPVLVLDANLPLTEMYKIYTKFDNQISNFEPSTYSGSTRINDIASLCS